MEDDAKRIDGTEDEEHAVDVDVDDEAEADSDSSPGQNVDNWDEDEPQERNDEPKRTIVTRGEPGVDYLGTGRRKTSTARVRLRRGSGDFMVNGKKLQEFFPVEEHRSQILKPFQITETMGLFNARVRVQGGGPSGQAGAVRLGFARALCEVDSELRTPLKKEGLLSRDSRMVERKKYGKKGARKSFQFSKR